MITFDEYQVGTYVEGSRDVLLRTSEINEHLVPDVGAVLAGSVQPN